MELIHIGKSSINGSEVNSVSARELYKSLDLGQGQFTRWSTKNIEENEFFMCGRDYLRVRHNVEGNDVIDFAVTLDVAKHLSMMAKTEKAHEIRNYFIEVEKQKNTQHLPQNYIEALEALTQAEKDKLALSETIKQKDEVIMAVADLNIKAGNVSISDFAKNLAIEGMGQNNMFAWLKGRGFLMMNTEPYQQYVERGYFVRKPYEKKVNGETRYRTMLTPKGTIWLAKMLRAEFEIEDDE